MCQFYWQTICNVQVDTLVSAPPWLQMQLDILDMFQEFCSDQDICSVAFACRCCQGALHRQTSSDGHLSIADQPEGLLGIDFYTECQTPTLAAKSWNLVTLVILCCQCIQNLA